MNLGAADGPPKASIIVFYRGRFPELAGAHDCVCIEDVSDVSDVLTDAKFIFGYKDKSRFNEAREILNKIKNKYPDTSIDMIGYERIS